jgi:mannosyltransferase
MEEEIDFEEAVPWLVGFMALVGWGLRVFLTSNKGLWLDEAFSIWLAKQNVAAMLHWIVQIDQHPPLYYLLLHYWVALNGDTISSVRMLSAIFGAATIPFIYLIGKRMSGTMTGLAAAALLVFSPFNIYYAQDTRMYTLLAFNASVAIYALVRLLTDPRSARPIGSQFREYLHAWRSAGPAEPDTPGDLRYLDTRARTGWRGWIYRHRWSPIQTIETDLAWVAFIVFSAATLLTHNTAVFFPLATNLFVLGLMLFQRSRKPGSDSAFRAPSLGNWVKAQVGIFVLWSPWIFVFIQQAGRVYQEFWVPQPTWDSVIHVLGSFFNANMMVLPAEVLVSWIMYLLVLVLGLVRYRKNISRFLFLAVLFATPFLGELLVSLRRTIFLDRTLIWITLPLLLALAAGIVQLKKQFLMIIVVGILCTNNLFSASDYYRYMKYVQIEDWSNATREVAAFAEPGDLVLFNAGWVQIPFDYYYKMYNLRAIPIEEHGAPADMFDRGILEPKMTESDVPRMISLLQGHARVWLVYSHNWYTDPNGIVPQTLASQMKLIQQDDYTGVRISLYGTP